MMRWHRHGHGHVRGRAKREAAQPAVVRESSEIRGLREARKGTAAEHPGLVVTPDRKAHRGAFVGDTFYEDRGTSFVQWTSRSQEEREREIIESDLAPENAATKDVWWLEETQRRPKENGGWTVRGGTAPGLPRR